MRVIKDNRSIEIKYCKNIFNRFLGLMFKKNINKCLCFPKCNSIHTFFMIKKIDVIMTDKDCKVLYIFKNVKPYRIILPKKKVYYTFEFPIDTFEYNIGEIVKVK